ncbi:hypothetical protein L3Q82_002567 [Scortum barcoo]|uniref:Uncharacterized protein n=1 Tax=Scortum barcoo TaxID=214431 RepID=A0ACB8VTZ0_9TELE|nr:hypothetical protein L3Q82_002567 [Scortum barcoo]
MVTPLPFLALIDSGADESLMDKALASSLGIMMEPLQNPVSARGQQRTDEQIQNPGDPDYRDISKVPPCYHDLKEVFNKAKAMSLPPPPSEKKAMEEYIETSLRSGIIRPSSSPAGARFFFVAPVLTVLDPALQFVVAVDASNEGVGAVLSQRSATDNRIHPCAFLSRKLTPAERNYNVGNKELLAVKVALEEWLHWLEGAEQPFIVLTDHKNPAIPQVCKKIKLSTSKVGTIL